MVVDMELQEAKDAVLQLMKDKDKIEVDLRALKEILDCVRIPYMIFRLRKLTDVIYFSKQLFCAA